MSTADLIKRCSPAPPLLPPQPHLPPSRLTEMEKKAPPSAAGFKTHYPPLLFFSLSPVILFCGLMPPRCSVVMKGAGLHGVHEEHRTLILRGGEGNPPAVWRHISGKADLDLLLVPPSTVCRRWWWGCSPRCVETGVCV